MRYEAWRAARTRTLDEHRAERQSKLTPSLDWDNYATVRDHENAKRLERLRGREYGHDPFWTAPPDPADELPLLDEPV